MPTLTEIFYSHTDKASAKMDHYFPVFERYLAKYIGKEFTLLEIGIGSGGSLQIWKKYFGDKVRVCGIDKNSDTIYSEPQIETYLGSQSDTDFLISTMKQIGPVDVIIDDASHVQDDIYNTFITLFPLLNDGGVYIIEDLHSSYWQEYDGGLDKPNNFVTRVSGQVHSVNKKWVRVPFGPIVDGITSMSFYDSMFVAEKDINFNPTFAHTGSVLVSGI